MQQFFIVIHYALVVYLLLITLRILSSWVSISGGGVISNFLKQVTDPYLQIFSRFQFLRIGFLDFSSVVAIYVLFAIAQTLLVMANVEQMTAGIFLSFSLRATWRIVRAGLMLFLIACIGRFLIIKASGTTQTPIGNLAASLSDVVVRIISRYIQLGKNSTESNYLILSILILLAMRILGNFAVRYLGNFFETYNLPI